MDYFLGVDNGGTLTKAVLFDSSGTPVGTASRKVAVLVGEPGHTERNMDDLWLANVEVIRESVERSGVDARSIRGVSCTGHGKGLYLWGKNNRPVGNGIISTDTRAFEYPQRWAKDGTTDRIYGKTFQSILACQPVALLNWLKDHRPKVLEQIRWIFAVKDFIRFRLTGEAYAEVTDYSGTNLLNLATGEFDKELLAEFGLDSLIDALPPLRWSTDLCGSITAEVSALTGLAAGTPVSGGMFDIDACAIAMDVTTEDRLCVIAGTWGINEYISKTPVTNGSIQMNSLFCLPGYYLVEESSPTSAGNNEWFLETFFGQEKAESFAQGRSVYDLINELVQSVRPGDTPYFYPYLYGSNYNAQARASLIGLVPGHTRAHTVRAVFEGIAFTHLVHLQKLLANRSRPSAVRLAGGAAKSLLWAQIFADVFNLPVEIVDAEELGTLGAAMTSAVASKVFPDLVAAAHAMVRIKQRIEPNPESVRIYSSKFPSYVRIADALDPLWAGLNAESLPKE